MVRRRKVKGKLFLRFHQDGESLCASILPKEKYSWSRSETFYITDHYLVDGSSYGWRVRETS